MKRISKKLRALMETRARNRTAYAMKKTKRALYEGYGVRQSMSGQKRETARIAAAIDSAANGERGVVLRPRQVEAYR